MPLPRILIALIQKYLSFSGQQIRLHLGQRQPRERHRRHLHVGRRRHEARRLRRFVRRRNSEKLSDQTNRKVRR